MEMEVNYTDSIRRKIIEMRSGAVITANTFPSRWPRTAVLRALSRLSKDGLIERVKKGVYSKVKETRFGRVQSTPLEILSKEVTEDENKCFGGLFLFNNLGLTTQVPSVIEILNNKSSYVAGLGETTVRYVRIRPLINKKTKRFVRILEVIKESKKIPDSNIEKTLSWILKEIQKMSESELKGLTKLSFDYPPRVRAILGSILQEYKKTRLVDKLENTLNKNSSYKVGRIAYLLKNAKAWRLKSETT